VQEQNLALNPEASEEDDILILPPDQRTVNLRSGRLRNNFSSHGQVSLSQLYTVSPPDTRNHYQEERQADAIIDSLAAFPSVILLEMAEMLNSWR
jgi:hypothetical protein